MAFSRPNANTSKQCQYFKLKTIVATKMRDKLGRRAHRQCIGRHLHFRNGRAGTPAQSGISGDRHGDDAGWQAGCHGALQQLHLGDQRMGRHASGVRTLHRKRSE